VSSKLEWTPDLGRLSDGSTVDVPAKHRVTAAADQEMPPVPAPDAAVPRLRHRYLCANALFSPFFLSLLCLFVARFLF